MKRRRAAPPPLAPGEHDARALEIANRRIVELETAKDAAVYRYLRLIDRHRQGCDHAQQLGNARWQLDNARHENADMYRRLCRALAMVKDANTSPTQRIEAIAAGPVDDQERP